MGLCVEFPAGREVIRFDLVKRGLAGGLFFVTLDATTEYDAAFGCGGGRRLTVAESGSFSRQSTSRMKPAPGRPIPRIGNMSGNDIEAVLSIRQTRHATR